MTAYYNENNPFAVKWLRNLIQDGHIAPGYVDDRSIEDVTPSDLRGFKQHHFFAGIGLWSLSLRKAGWSDDRKVWTASCPCQPFSEAGEGHGFHDDRHLWPVLEVLAREYRPECVFGEQVASKDSGPWLDLVQTDLEALGYAFGAVAFPSAGVGAPHIRDRTYWMAYRNDKRLEGRPPLLEREAQQLVGASGMAVGVAYDELQQRQEGQPSSGYVVEKTGWQQSAAEASGFCSDLRPGPTNGIWRNADWIGCADGKWRPVEPGTFPMDHGDPTRVGKLRAYGNAINPEQAKIFIEAGMEYIA